MSESYEGGFYYTRDFPETESIDPTVDRELLNMIYDDLNNVCWAFAGCNLDEADKKNPFISYMRRQLINAAKNKAEFDELTVTTSDPIAKSIMSLIERAFNNRIEQAYIDNGVRNNRPYSAWLGEDGTNSDLRALDVPENAVALALYEITHKGENYQVFIGGCVKKNPIKFSAFSSLGSKPSIYIVRINKNGSYDGLNKINDASLIEELLNEAQNGNKALLSGNKPDQNQKGILFVLPREEYENQVNTGVDSSPLVDPQAPEPLTPPPVVAPRTAPSPEQKRKIPGLSHLAQILLYIDEKGTRKAAKDIVNLGKVIVLFALAVPVEGTLGIKNYLDERRRQKVINRLHRQAYKSQQRANKVPRDRSASKTRKTYGRPSLHARKPSSKVNINRIKRESPGKTRRERLKEIAIRKFFPAAIPGKPLFSSENIIAGGSTPALFVKMVGYIGKQINTAVLRRKPIPNSLPDADAEKLLRELAAMLSDPHEQTPTPPSESAYEAPPDVDDEVDI